MVSNEEGDEELRYKPEAERYAEERRKITYGGREISMIDRGEGTPKEIYLSEERIEALKREDLYTSITTPYYRVF